MVSEKGKKLALCIVPSTFRRFQIICIYLLKYTEIVFVRLFYFISFLKLQLWAGKPSLCNFYFVVIDKDRTKSLWEPRVAPRPHFGHPWSQAFSLYYRCFFFSTDIQHLFDRTNHSQMRKAASGLCPLHRRLQGEQLNSLEMTGLLLHCSSLYQLLAMHTNSQNKPHFHAVRAFQLYVVTAAPVVRTDQASERCEICYRLAAAQTSGPAIICMHVLRCPMRTGAFIPGQPSRSSSLSLRDVRLRFKSCHFPSAFTSHPEQRDFIWPFCLSSIPATLSLVFNVVSH